MTPFTLCDRCGHAHGLHVKKPGARCATQGCDCEGFAVRPIPAPRSIPLTATTPIGTCHNCRHKYDYHPAAGGCEPGCDCPAYRGATPKTNLSSAFQIRLDMEAEAKRVPPYDGTCESCQHLYVNHVPGQGCFGKRGKGEDHCDCNGFVVPTPPPLEQQGRGVCAKCSHLEDQHSGGFEYHCVAAGCNCLNYLTSLPTPVAQPRTLLGICVRCGHRDGQHGTSPSCCLLGDCPCAQFVPAPPPPGPQVQLDSIDTSIRNTEAESKTPGGICARCSHPEDQHITSSTYCIVVDCNCHSYLAPVAPPPTTKMQGLDWIDTPVRDTETEALASAKYAPHNPMRPDERAAINRVYVNGDACRTCPYFGTVSDLSQPYLRECRMLTGEAPADSYCPGTIPATDTLPIRRCCDDRCTPPRVHLSEHKSACHHRNCINKTEPGCLCCDAANAKPATKVVTIISGKAPTIRILVTPHWLDLETARHMYVEADTPVPFAQWLVNTYAEIRDATEAEAEWSFDHK